MAPITKITRVSLKLNTGIERLTGTCGIIMTLIVVLQVFCRYVLNHSLFWSEELARFLLVWLSFLGATVAYCRGMHPAVDLVYKHLPPGFQKSATISVHLAAIAFFGVMTFFGLKFSYFVRLQISPALHLPKWIIFGAIPISGAIFLIHAINFLIGELRNKKP